MTRWGVIFTDPIQILGKESKKKGKGGVGGTEALKFLAFLAFGAFLFISFHHACLKHTHDFCIVLVFVFDSWESTLVVSGKRIILPDLRESMPDHFPRDHKLRWWIIPRLIYPRHKHTYNHWQTGKPWKIVQFETWRRSELQSNIPLNRYKGKMTGQKIN